MNVWEPWTTLRKAFLMSELSALQQHESVIESGLQTFVAVGNALRAIRDERLYKLSHATFEEYVRDRWGWTRQRAYQLIDVAGLEVSNKFDKSTHAAEVAKAPAEKQAEVVELAEQRAASENRRPVARDFAAARQQVLDEPREVDGELVLDDESNDYLEYEDADDDDFQTVERVDEIGGDDTDTDHRGGGGVCRRVVDGFAALKDDRIGTLFAIEEQLRPHERIMLLERLQSRV